MNLLITTIGEAMKKFLLFSLTLILSIFFLAGCSDSGRLPVDEQATETPVDETGLNDVEDGTKMTIYTIDYNTVECVPTVSVVDESDMTTAGKIVEEVIVNFKEEVIVTDISENKDSITVSFSDESAPIVNVTETMELAMLDCIAYSLLDNLEYCNEVFFKTHEKGYSSTHNSWAHDEPYVSK